ncbi:MAG: hypothetical protein JO069_22825 [Verrucomicrobia bacterium]|nr:hypothetical protein [Verrucomicrobiota bacterium]
MANLRLLWMAGLIGALLCLLSLAQEPEQPAPGTGSSPSPLITPQPEPSPTPSVTPPPRPENAAPDLLPEIQGPPPPSATPTPNPRDLLPYGPVPQVVPSPSQLSATQQLNDLIRFRELRTLSERDPYAVWLWQSADRVTTIESKREYLRAYYRYTAARMEKMEPRLRAMIRAYEYGRLGSVTQTNIRPTIPLYKLDGADRQQPSGRDRNR